jgi:5-methylcytosine-specific restriction endonuclease McrA
VVEVFLPRPEEMKPLSPGMFRVAVTASAEFKRKLEASKDALASKFPEGKLEEILMAGLDLVLAQAEKKRGLVEKPRATHAVAPKGPTVPRAMKREVWRRDEGRCQWPMAHGGICGSTRDLEYDHVVPRACGGPTSVRNLRLLCSHHNQQAAEEIFGREKMARYRRRRDARLESQALQASFLSDKRDASRDIELDPQQ